MRLCALLLLLAAGACSKAAPAVAPPKQTALTRPWEMAFPVTAVPKGLSSLRSTECARCHPEQRDEWLTSAHGQAWVDPQFQTEWKKDHELWLCVNCHAPLANQQPKLVSGLYEGDFQRPVTQDNPAYDPGLRDEGITCASCHVRDGQVLSGRPPSGTAPHPSRQDEQALSHQACTRCHNAKADLTDTLVCTFDTGDDWGQTELPAQGVGCLDCHMPQVTRLTVEGAVKVGRRHDFLGAGIPKKDAGDPAPGRSGLWVEVSPDPKGYRRGQKAVVPALIANRFAGHTVPTGDVERWVEVHFRLLDEEGKVLWSQVEKLGETWEWWPKAKRLSDTSLPRNASRDLSLEIPLPKSLKRAELEVLVVNHRMTPKTHAWAKLPADYPLSAEAWRSITPLTLRGAR